MCSCFVNKTMELINVHNFMIYALMVVCILTLVQPEDFHDYIDKRNILLQNEKSMQTGANLILSMEEVKANGKLMTYKWKEFNSSQIFTPSLHFFKARQYIEDSVVFKIIQQMPKGAALHLHDTSMVDLDWLIEKATYMNNCYMCYRSGQKKDLIFRFSEAPPAPIKDCEWKLTTEIRKLYSKADFDTWLYNNMTLIVKDPEASYPNQNAVWKRFKEIFGVADGLILYKEVFVNYFYEALQEFYDDNVQYIEFRGLLLGVYDLSGHIFSPEWIVSAYHNISQSFVKKHPDFIGSKFIYSNSRHGDYKEILNGVKLALKLQKLFPDFVVGYDLVGQEDAGHSLKYFIDALLYPSKTGQKLNYFFHAGETDWDGTSVDENVIDALLLNTTRIGHGYALLKHPRALQVGKNKGVAVEVCPISNQVLKLVNDLRNHPAVELLATNYPVVISADDPALWGARGLSYDFYEAFMGLGGKQADLRFLKQLAINSIKYSAMKDNEKSMAMKHWESKWEQFIKIVNAHF